MKLRFERSRFGGAWHETGREPVWRYGAGYFLDASGWTWVDCGAGSSLGTEAADIVMPSGAPLQIRQIKLKRPGTFGTETRRVWSAPGATYVREAGRDHALAALRSVLGESRLAVDYQRANDEEVAARVGE